MTEILSTYRLQLHAAMPLTAAAELVDYLRELGVTHLYSSPLLQARPGSTHGYDVVDPTRLDGEIGTETEFGTLAARLRAARMGMVLDIVPNHMATARENERWQDVLRHGQASRFARWFDIEWRASERDLRHRVLLPVLGDQRSRVLERGEITLAYEDGEFRVRYFEHSYPVNPATLPVEPGAAPEALAERARAFGEGPEGRRRLRKLLDAQPYRLVHWRRAARELNYRRFFDVNDLIALNMEDPAVFAESHALVLTWLAEGRLDGLRVDHPDGLLEPRRYLERLAQVAGGCPVWVEKILVGAERLPDDWPVAGTVGYDFLDQLEACFIEPAGWEALLADYRRVTRMRLDFAAVARQAKRLVLESSLSAGVRRLAERLLRLRPDEWPRVTRHEAYTAIVETIVSLPVYRTYVDAERPEPAGEDRLVLQAALAAARERGRAGGAALDLLQAALLAEPGPLRSAASEGQRVRFVERFQQVAGPAMAKGVEDTAFYRWVPLLSRCEVGAEPEAPLAHALEEFHAANAHRAARWPRAMLAGTTHDTKRGADVRARLDVLSELPELWEAHLYRWRRLARGLKPRVAGRRVPDANTEYLFFQTLVGIWPLEHARAGAPVPDAHCLGELAARLEAYMQKAAREAKTETSWVDPDEPWEAALAGFVRATLDPARSRALLEDVAAFVARLARPGCWSALARLVLQGAAPGVPDCYQGDELWNFVLVDPDNRRPVDYGRRRALLAEVARFDGAGEGERGALVASWAGAADDGRIKLHVRRAVLHARRRWPAAFVGAEYVPLAADGERARHVVAFARTPAPSGNAPAVVAVAGRWLAAAAERDAAAPPPAFWSGTTLPLPGALAHRRWRCALTGAAVADAAGRLALGEALRRLPVALLVEERA
ncbi:MAG TPA: malto-oligosyltrehalose synthase, partial [Gemmatimonadales bacterium]|nr:malto-oligosyltrehalose synthase [Gemmatimonadales bacterium]